MDQFLKDTIKEAGALAKTYFLRGVSHKTKKHLADLVTEADHAVSDYIVEQIQATYPDHGIHSEERDEIINNGGEYLWMIDPIDGTRNFAHGIPVWCVMIALFHHGELYMSAMYDPLSDELFFAEKGKGATMNGMPISVNETAELDYAYGACVRDQDKPEAEKCYKVSHVLHEEYSTWMHNFGTMLLTAYIASGGVDFYAGNAGWDHDYSAAVLIVREAGGLVTDFEGNDWERGHTDIIFGNPQIHEKVVELFKAA